MVELVGDPCVPSILVVPQKHGDTTDGSTTKPTMSGGIVMSGAKLYFYNGEALKAITSQT